MRISNIPQIETLALLIIIGLKPKFNTNMFKDTHKHRIVLNRVKARSYCQEALLLKKKGINALSHLSTEKQTL